MKSLLEDPRGIFSSPGHHLLRLDGAFSSKEKELRLHKAGGKMERACGGLMMVVAALLVALGLLNQHEPVLAFFLAVMAMATGPLGSILWISGGKK